MTIQLRINNIYNNNYASTIRHNITLWRMTEAYIFGYSLVMIFQIAKLK